MNTITMREIAVMAEIPESTLRLYRDEFEEFLPAVGAGRRRRYSRETAERLVQIVREKKEGIGAGQIRERLAQQTTPAAKSRRITTEDRLDEIMVLVRTLTQEVVALRAEVGALRTTLSSRPSEAPRRFEDALRESQQGGADRSRA